MQTLVYYAHPGQHLSRANVAMAQQARQLDGVTFVDLYADYPRFDIDVAREQRRLLDHDLIVFQFPLFWYSTPSLIKEWQDLVLQHGFAYGHDGTHLTGKKMMLAVTTGGSDEAYTAQGYQHYPLRDFLRPLEQTARLCGMEFLPPYVLYGALGADEAAIAEHAHSYSALLSGIRDDRMDLTAAAERDLITATDIPSLIGA